MHNTFIIDTNITRNILQYTTNINFCSIVVMFCTRCHLNIHNLRIECKTSGKRFVLKTESLMFFYNNANNYRSTTRLTLRKHSGQISRNVLGKNDIETGIITTSL